MIYKRQARRFCYEDPSLIENYDKAIADQSQTWEIHHRVESIMNCGAEELIAQGCYKDRPAHDLIFLTKAEHRRLHKLGNANFIGHHHSEATRSKMSASRKGKKKSAEYRAKLAEAARQYWQRQRGVQ